MVFGARGEIFVGGMGDGFPPIRHHRAAAKRRDPVISIDGARLCLPKRDGRDKPGHDE
jgi:hypothetical protein